MPKPAESGAEHPKHSGTGVQTRGSGSVRSARVGEEVGLRVTPSPDVIQEQGELNDAWLVERARHGDDRAFGVLVMRYERKLIRVLERLVGDYEQARDLAQETFWRIHQRLDRFDAARRFGPWLFRVGVNLGVDWLRKVRIEASSLSVTRGSGSVQLDPANPDPRVHAELAEEVHFILGRLAASHRVILILRDLEGLSTSEVAAIVGRREPTVRWRLALARQRFRELWSQRMEGRRQQAREGTPRCELNND